jgi:FkbM family methyltransferase
MATNSLRQIAVRFARKYLPRAVVEGLRSNSFYIDRRNRASFRQGTVTCRYGNVSLTVPRNHPITKIGKTQPYRNLNIALAARYLYRKYPDKIMVDIGANVGDTAALIASQAKSDLLLIESSPYFFEFLVENSRLLGNRVRLLKSFIGSGESISGDLVHWAGTAYVLEKPGRAAIPTRRLEEVCQEPTCLVKIDTDGFDFDIILASLEFWKAHRPAIIFENQIRDLDGLTRCNEVFQKLFSIGYEHFLVWDDAGFLIVSTHSLDTLAELNRYLFEIWHHAGATKTIYNYDVLCLTGDDKDLLESIRSHYSQPSLGLSG